MSHVLQVGACAIPVRFSRTPSFPLHLARTGWSLRRSSVHFAADAGREVAESHNSVISQSHTMGSSGTIPRFSLTRVQHRDWCQMARVIAGFRAAPVLCPSLADPRSALHHNPGTGYVPSSGLSYLFGLRGGLPVSASLVATASVAEAMFATMQLKIEIIRRCV